MSSVRPKFLRIATLERAASVDRIDVFGFRESGFCRHVECVAFLDMALENMAY